MNGGWNLNGNAFVTVPILNRNEVNFRHRMPDGSEKAKMFVKWRQRRISLIVSE